MKCDYVERGGKFICRICGDTRDYHVNRRCGKSAPDDGPGIVTKILNYAKAVRRWTAEGKPTRTDQQVSDVLAICKQCEFYDGEICLHHKCGCKVNNNKWAIINKIRMATESCPIGKWKATVEVESQ